MVEGRNRDEKMGSADEEAKKERKLTIGGERK